MDEPLSPKHTHYLIFRQSKIFSFMNSSHCGWHIILWFCQSVLHLCVRSWIWFIFFRACGKTLLLLSLPDSFAHVTNLYYFAFETMVFLPVMVLYHPNFDLIFCAPTARLFYSDYTPILFACDGSVIYYFWLNFLVFRPNCIFVPVSDLNDCDCSL